MEKLLNGRLRMRAWYLLAFVITIFIGLASRHFSPVLPAFAGKYPGDALSSLMVFFGFGAIFPTASTFRLSVGVLGFSCGIEVLKLCHAPWLANVRHTTLGHLVFGSVFSWQNLVAYALGVMVGVIIEVFFVKNPPPASGRDGVQHGRPRA